MAVTKVLIVDDERFVRLGVKNETDWALIGCEVVGEAADGAAALELFDRLSPDLVISDIKMPVMDGIELARRITEKKPNVKIIFLTAFSDFEYARQAVRLGVSDYLLKPFRDGELEASVQRLMHSGKIVAGGVQPEDELIPMKKKSDFTNRYITGAIDYIEKNYADPCFSVSGLAETLGVSEGHISRTFKAETEMGINSYLTRYRIRKAMEILKDVQVKVYEAAGMVGYQDIAYFSNTFKKLVGKTPSDYQLKGL